MYKSFFVTTPKSTWVFVWLLALCSLVSCKTSPTPTDTAAVLRGRWQETWDNGKDNNVKYDDVYRVEVKGTEVAIFGITHSYQIEKVSFEQNTLQFELTNTDKYIKEAIRIHYTLHYDQTKDILEGKALNSKGVHAKILWKRYN